MQLGTWELEIPIAIMYTIVDIVNFDDKTEYKGTLKNLHKSHKLFLLFFYLELKK